MCERPTAASLKAEQLAALMNGSDPIKLSMTWSGICLLKNTFSSLTFVTWITRNPDSGISTKEEALQALAILESTGKIETVKDDIYQLKESTDLSAFKTSSCGVKASAAWKKGQVFWNLRYIVLSKGTIYYYDEPKSVTPRQIIPLEGSVFNYSDCSIWNKTNFGINFTAPNGRYHVMNFTSKKLQEEWLSALQGAGAVFSEDLEDLKVSQQSFYDFKIEDLYGNVLDLNQFAMKPSIVVNVASN